MTELLERLDSLTAAQAAKMLGVSFRQAYALAAPAGPIPCYRIGRSVRFSQSDLLEYLESCRYIEAKSAVRSSLSSAAVSMGKESALLKSFQKLGIKPKLTHSTDRNQQGSTQQPKGLEAQSVL